MTSDKTFRTELSRTFLIEALPAPLERNSAHLQIFDNYIHETGLRLRSVREPKTKRWTRLLQKRESVHGGERRIQDIELSEGEYEHFKQFEGNEIRKNRYFTEFDGRRFEFDVYLGPLRGLNRARVRIGSREEMGSFVRPEFATMDVTGLPFFDDSNLVNCGFEDVQVEIEKLLGSSSGKRISTI